MVRKNYRDVYRKGRIIQAWRALNLYNLAKFQEPRSLQKTFYQQKWQAKSYSRTYHGRQVREKQWQLMFNRKIPSMVEMKVQRLAQDDGSGRAAGRGSGKDDANWLNRYPVRTTPYMSMTYWPLERRLDTAIFRAMFASSVRTARQFCIHGHVKVNGKKIKYPGYLLNPGDMFSVNPEMVMLATGMRNSESNRVYVQKNPPPDAPRVPASKLNADARRKEQKKKAEEAGAQAVETSNAEPSSMEPSGENTAAETTAPTAALGIFELKAKLKDLDQEISKYVATPNNKGYVFRTRRKTRLYKLRELRRQVREAIKTAEDSSPELTTQLKNLTNRLNHTKIDSDPVESHIEQVTRSGDEKSTKAPPTHLELLKTWPNVRRQDKPYLTPWLPRNWMGAFAFIPRYLEVNQNVCSAVYLRHPVARPGLAEVPSPYSKEMNLLAYQWYLRRR